jgi:hypothetical protein
VLETGLAIMRELCPWHRAMCDDLVPLDDPHGMLKGRFAPQVRQAFGTTASGHRVMPLGDAAVTFDPIAGQGANHAARHARFLAEAVIAQAAQGFDQNWMERQHHIWWHSDAKFAYALSNLFLEAPSIAMKTVLLEVAQNPAFASRFFVPGMTDPKRLFPAMEDFAAARHLVSHWKNHRPQQPVALPWWTSGMGWESAFRRRLSANLYPAPGFARSVLYDLPDAA